MLRIGRTAAYELCRQWRVTGARRPPRPRLRPHVARAQGGPRPDAPIVGGQLMNGHHPDALSLRRDHGAAVTRVALPPAHPSRGRCGTTAALGRATRSRRGHRHLRPNGCDGKKSLTTQSTAGPLLADDCTARLYRPPPPPGV